MASHSSILAWGRLAGYIQSMGSQEAVYYSCNTNFSDGGMFDTLHLQVLVLIAALVNVIIKSLPPNTPGRGWATSTLFESCPED